MLTLLVYVPGSHLETLKEALFTAGAGRLGSYDRCSWQVAGSGQFRPLEGSDPYLGKCGSVEQVEEWRLELVCERVMAPAVRAALIDAHPYETPAFHFLETVLF